MPAIDIQHGAVVLAHNPARYHAMPHAAQALVPFARRPKRNNLVVISLRHAHYWREPAGICKFMLYDRLLKPAEVEAFFATLHAANPEPKGELYYTNPFTLLVAVVLSAQATDKGVNKATPALFKAADTPEKMAALGEDKIRDYIKTIGLNKAKAKNVHLLSQRLIDVYASEVPQTMDDLITLPGVGRKTANVVLNIAFGHETIAVDTHLFRVSNRTGLAPGKTPDAVEQRLLKVVPAQFRRHAHHWLILHGRYICLARKPGCPECPVAHICRFRDKTPGAQVREKKKTA